MLSSLLSLMSRTYLSNKNGVIVSSPAYVFGNPLASPRRTASFQRNHAELGRYPRRGRQTTGALRQ
jgi:hypothetical protein